MTIIYHGQPRGTLRRNWKQWGSPLRKFRIFVDVIFKSNIDINQAHAHAQTQGVLDLLGQAGVDIAQGVDVIMSSCWECQSVPASNKPRLCLVVQSARPPAITAQLVKKTHGNQATRQSVHKRKKRRTNFAKCFGK
jgi:hypothetical protein